MSLLSKVSDQIKGLPRAPQPAIPAKELWITFIGSIVGLGITAAHGF